LSSVPTVEDPIFGLMVPTCCPEVPSEFLQPRSTWGDQAAYDRAARALAEMFAANFEHFASGVPESVRKAGPRITWEAGPSSRSSTHHEDSAEAG
jgi:phosphoenolpyruvate carboxykinase (ATP)